MLPLTRLKTTGLVTLITPPLVGLVVSTTQIIRPHQPNCPAKVTTKEGRCSRVTRVPCRTPMAVPVAKPATTATIQGRFTDGLISRATMTADNPAT